MEAPAFLIDNEYILRGYRINFNTNKRIFRSLFLLHNETVNVWSHLLGVFAFIGFLIYTWASLYASSTFGELLQSSSYYMNKHQEVRRELTLANHSSLAQVTDFQAFCEQYLHLPKSPAANLSSAY
jgi:hypothetical protein